MPDTHGPDRRRVLGGSLGVATGAVVGGQAPSAYAEGPTGERPPQQPNVVLIMLDDVGYGDWSSYGSTQISTPRIDGVGAEGVTCTQMYAGGPVCTPARAALLTGRLAQRVGLSWVVFPGDPRGMSDYERTLGELLRDVGYRTGIFGKWHLGAPGVRPELNPVYHGFDTFFGTPQSNQPEPFPLYDDTALVDMLDDVEQIQLSGRCTDRALEFIRQNRDVPFFAYLPYNPAHTPYHVEKDFQGTSRAGAYGDLVQQADYHIGRVLDELDALGLTDDTLVMITSDNGPTSDGTGGLRGGKGTTFEGGIRMPFVARWPRHIQAGQTCAQPASFADVVPTVAGVAGASVPHDRPIDGIDLLPAFQGAAVQHRELYHYHDWDLNAVRSGRWKLHCSLSSQPGSSSLPLLYDLEVDPGETRDLADQRPTVVRRLSALADRFGEQIEAQRPAAERRARGEN